jgi:hypothetical protein
MHGQQNINISKGLQTFYGKGPNPLLWAGSRAARRKMTVGVITAWIIVKFLE